MKETSNLKMHQIQRFICNFRHIQKEYKSKRELFLIKKIFFFFNFNSFFFWFHYNIFTRDPKHLTSIISDFHAVL